MSCPHCRSERIGRALDLTRDLERQYGGKEKRTVTKFALFPKQDPATNRWFWWTKVNIYQTMHVRFSLELHYPMPKWETDKIEHVVTQKHQEPGIAPGS